MNTLAKASGRQTDPDTLPAEVRAFIRANPETTVFEVVERFAMNPARDRARIAVAIDAVRPSPSEDQGSSDTAGAARGGAGA